MLLSFFRGFRMLAGTPVMMEFAWGFFFCDKTMRHGVIGSRRLEGTYLLHLQWSEILGRTEFDSWWWRCCTSSKHSVASHPRTTASTVTTLRKPQNMKVIVAFPYLSGQMAWWYINKATTACFQILSKFGLSWTHLICSNCITFRLNTIQLLAQYIPLLVIYIVAISLSLWELLDSFT